MLDGVLIFRYEAISIGRMGRKNNSLLWPLRAGIAAKLHAGTAPG